MVDQGKTRAPTRRTQLWLAAAAVLAAGAWLVLRFLAPTGESHDPMYLGEGLHLQAPLGAVPSFAPFRWTYTGGEPELYELRIYASRDGARGELLLGPVRLGQNTWTPDAQEEERLPDRILWEVQALDEFRSVLPSGTQSAEAWRSSR